MTPDERAELKALVAEAVAEALAAREPRKKSRAGLLTLAEASALVRTPASTIRFWIWQGKLAAYKPGRVVLVKESELLAHVEANESTARRAARANSVARGENESEG